MKVALLHVSFQDKGSKQSVSTGSLPREAPFTRQGELGGLRGDWGPSSPQN